MKLEERVHKPAVDFLTEFCTILKPWFAAKKAKGKKKKAAAKAPKAGKKVNVPKAKAAKKVALKKAGSSGSLKKSASSGSVAKAGSSTAAMPFAARLALARKAGAGMTRQQSKTADELARAGAESHKWQFLSDASKWCDYAPAASVLVEKAYASWVVDPHVDVRAVKSGDWEYMVDFNLMQQQNVQHPAHKIRKVKRVAVGGEQP